MHTTRASVCLRVVIYYKLVEYTESDCVAGNVSRASKLII